MAPRGMPWLFYFLLLVNQPVKYIDDHVTPAIFRSRPISRWKIFMLVVLCHRVIHFVYTSLQTRISGYKATMLPKSREDCTVCARNGNRRPQGYISLFGLQEVSEECVRCRTMFECILTFSDRWKGTALSEVRVIKWWLTGKKNEQSVELWWPENDPQAVTSYPGFGSQLMFLKILYGERFASGIPVRDEEFGLPVPVESQSDACMDFIRARIDHCSMNHKLCSANSKTLFTPKRLIDTGPEDLTLDEVFFHLRLIETASLMDQTVRYIALSYCWGDEKARIKPIPKLTTSTMQTRLAHISAGELTKTFEDAVIIARQLSLRYLWIDALCIIQDSGDDFAEQAGQMALIYGMAHVVISVTRAATGDIGIFHRRIGPHEVCFVDTKDRSSTAYVKEAKFHDEFIVNDPSSFRRTPVFARAWCFQERLLARRVVHFAEDEIVWECNDQLRCECGSLDLEDYNGISFKTRQARRLLPSTCNTKDEFGLEARRSYWFECVHTYTSRHLSHESDRLPALSGYAHDLHIPGMGKYLAGLWEFQGPSAFLWFITHSRTNERSGRVFRCKDNQIPSWSWASIQGTILLHYMVKRKIVARIMEMHCHPAIHDIFGQVVPHAYVALEAPVLQLVLVRHGTEERQWGLRPIGFVSLPPTTRVVLDRSESGEVSKDEQHQFFADVDLETPNHIDHVPVGSCVLCVVIEEQGRPEDSSPPRALMLREYQLEAVKVAGYRRVGVFDVPNAWLLLTKRDTVKIF